MGVVGVVDSGRVGWGVVMIGMGGEGNEWDGMVLEAGLGFG